MIVNVAQLLRSEIGASRHYAFDEAPPAFGDDIRVAGPVVGEADLIRTNVGILVRGHFATTLELDCSRCLEPAIQDVSIDFDEVYLPVVDVVSGAPLSIPKDNVSFLISDKHELDLGLAVREYGLLELPMKPLCRPECRGLCPHCGANRNLVACRCAADFADERFAVLRTLLTTEIESN